ncbi:MAG TPA: ABC transporter, partial [Gallionella sp.]|nr:ABC transporter [Gallionella sp.]
MRKFFTALSLRNVLIVLLVAAATTGLYQLAKRYHLQRDVTYNALNSLEPSSVQVLKQLKGPV